MASIETQLEKLAIHPSYTFTTTDKGEVTFAEGTAESSSAALRELIPMRMRVKETSRHMSYGWVFVDCFGGIVYLMHHRILGLGYVEVEVSESDMTKLGSIQELLEKGAKFYASTSRE